MIAVVGLGNVGDKYINTRHNVGFMFVDEFTQEVKNNKNIISFKPASMMNSSGVWVKKLTESRNLETDNLYVVHDDLDLKLGEYKIQFGKGPKVHNGVNSVEENLGTADFWRVRIGVDNRDPENRIPGEEYVLESFTQAELSIIKRTIEEVCKKLAKL